jgi:hypothetical protein
LIAALKRITGRCRRYLEEQENGEEYLQQSESAIAKATTPKGT